MTKENKAKAITGTKKALGQLNRVLKMLEEDAYCMDVMQQIRAVEGLLNSVSSSILESHLHTCTTKAFTSKDEKQHKKVIDELLVAFKAAKK